MWRTCLISWLIKVLLIEFKFSFVLRLFHRIAVSLFPNQNTWTWTWTCTLGKTTVSAESCHKFFLETHSYAMTLQQVPNDRLSSLKEMMMFIRDSIVRNSCSMPRALWIIPRHHFPLILRWNKPSRGCVVGKGPPCRARAFQSTILHRIVCVEAATPVSRLLCLFPFPFLLLLLLLLFFF